MKLKENSFQDHYNADKKELALSARLVFEEAEQEDVLEAIKALIDCFKKED